MGSAAAADTAVDYRTVAGFIALAAVAVAGGMLIFGGESTDFARRLMYIVLVAGVLLRATQIVGLFGATGASLVSLESVQLGRAGDCSLV